MSKIVLNLGSKIKIEENDNCLNMNNGCIKNIEIISSKTSNTDTLNVNKSISLNNNIINNIGDGVKDNDAVNLGQLTKALSTININDIKIANQLNDEVLRAKNSENLLSNQINDEFTRAKNNETILANQLNDEAIRAKNFENTLLDKLNNEIVRIDNIDKAQSNIDKETLAKVNALYLYFFGKTDIDLVKN